MKKPFITLLVCLMCLAGCGNNPGNDNQNNENTELENNERVEVDESLLTVTITLPNSFFETFDTTAEEYVNKVEGGNSFFNKVEMNDDGSVSITTTKAQYNEYMAQLEKTTDESLQVFTDNEDYAISSIAHNKDFSEFKVTLDNDEVGLTESFMVIVFAMYGGIYQLFAGVDNTFVRVIYIGSDGSELLNWDSSQLAESSQ